MRRRSLPRSNNDKSLMSVDSASSFTELIFDADREAIGSFIESRLRDLQGGHQRFLRSLRGSCPHQHSFDQECLVVCASRKDIRPRASSDLAERSSSRLPTVSPVLTHS